MRLIVVAQRIAINQHISLEGCRIDQIIESSHCHQEKAYFFRIFHVLIRRCFNCELLFKFGIPDLDQSIRRYSHEVFF